VLALLIAALVATLIPVSIAAQTSTGNRDRIVAVYSLEALSLAAVQNAVLPGSVTNDRSIRLGGSGAISGDAPVTRPASTGC